MAGFITPAQLAGRMPSGWSDAQVQEEIDAALAWVRIHVPCLDNLDDNKVAAVNAVLRKAVPWNANLSTSVGGTVNRVNAGPLSYSTETTTPRDSGGYFSPAQVAVLGSLCGSSRRVGTIRMRPTL
jgi:hypothetical protein